MLCPALLYERTHGFRQLRSWHRANCVIGNFKYVWLEFRRRIKTQSSFPTPDVDPTMPITHSDLMAITIPSDADHRRSQATLGIPNDEQVIASVNLL